MVHMTMVVLVAVVVAVMVQLCGGSYSENNDSTGTTFETVHWPGKLLSGWTNGNNEGKTLRIGVPAKGAFTNFVNVTYDESKKETSITGFSIDVFKAAVERLPYPLQY